MLQKYNIKSYAIIVVLAVALILPFNAIAQTKSNKFTKKEQREKKPVRQNKQIKKTVKSRVKVSDSAELSKKIAALEEELSRTKTALLEASRTGVEKDKTISTLTARMKGVQALVSERDAELVALKDAYEKYKEVTTCYRTALSAWDNLRRRRGLAEQDHLTISTELRFSISKCPPI